MSYKIIVIVVFLLLAGSENVRSQSQNIAAVDSTVMEYYQKCLKDILNPVVLTMADTLFNMAGNEGDKRMQAVALCTKLDHYYYTQHEHKKDSIIAWVERVQHFAKKTEQPKYYYFVWGGRLISYYLVQGEYNIALLEAEKLLKETKTDDFKEGIADCYHVLSNIYLSKQLTDKALEFLVKEIELFEKYGLERYNISMEYTSAGRLLLDQERIDEAFEYLQKGEKYIYTSFQEVYLKLAYVLYYLQKNELSKSSEFLEECRTIYATDESNKQRINYLYSVEMQYYSILGKYDEALRVAGLLEEVLEQKGEKVSIVKLYAKKADIYWEMDRKEDAATFYRLSLEEMEKAKVEAEEKTTAEFATLLNMQNLASEKEELEERSRKKQLQYTQTVVILLIMLLIVVVFFLCRQKELNRLLEKSRDILNEKNQALRKAKEELQHAKEVAEESSRMKTVFIQNMSHEIRTPLNSIVGFSAVLSEIFSEGDDEVKECALTIENNSRLLLKMINDILSISDLDEENKQIIYRPVHINDCCLRAVEETTPFLTTGVNLIFNPLPEDPVVTSNDELLMHVLRNLLNNAAKFTSVGNILFDYEIHKSSNELIFTVADTGIGIPKDRREFVFKRFAKLNEFTQGTGLGLSISQLAAQKLGAHLAIDAEYTQGARFVFTVPLR